MENEDAGSVPTDAPVIRDDVEMTDSGNHHADAPSGNDNSGAEEGKSDVDPALTTGTGQSNSNGNNNNNSDTQAMWPHNPQFAAQGAMDHQQAPGFAPYPPQQIPQQQLQQPNGMYAGAPSMPQQQPMQPAPSYNQAYPQQQPGAFPSSGPSNPPLAPAAASQQQHQTIYPAPPTSTSTSAGAPAPAPATASQPPRGLTPQHATQPQGQPQSLLSQAIMPAANEAGSSTRVYLNQKVTPALLEGMKWVAANEPEKPLKWLGEFLLRRSEEVEGGKSGEKGENGEREGGG
ncbi:MAG: hypothetical protein M1831_000365 [Alyxoria varia]|nr:MAG: hypothetical protein M1831_000365 [Alyxoria varia]